MASDKPTVAEGLAIQRDAIRAIQEITGRFSEADWHRPTPCTAWTAHDLAGHLLTVTTMYNEALDDAEAGISTPRWKWEDLPRHNDEYLAALPPGSGPDRVATFADRASRWFDRLADADPGQVIPLAAQDFASVPITVELFAWVGGLEWHIHAWDFAQTVGEDYKTPDAQTILNGAMALRGATTPPDNDPWRKLLGLYRQPSDYSEGTDAN